MGSIANKALPLIPECLPCPLLAISLVFSTYLFSFSSLFFSFHILNLDHKMYVSRVTLTPRMPSLAILLSIPSSKDSLLVSSTLGSPFFLKIYPGGKQCLYYSILPVYASHAVGTHPFPPIPAVL
mgnify:CR=1 FL=1